MEEVIKNYEAIQKGMRVSVNIPWDERDRIVVEALIEIRNSEANKNEDMSHFDEVLEHYLDPEEFYRYVVLGEKITTD